MRRRDGDFLGDDGVVIGGDGAGGFAEEERGAAGVGVALGEDASANFGEAGVDGVGGDGAARDVDEVEARALAEKADREIGALRGVAREGRWKMGDGGGVGDGAGDGGFLGGGGGVGGRKCGGGKEGAPRRIEMRGDFGPIAVGARGGNDGGDGEGDAGHVFEEFGDLPALPVSLLGVVEMLILAAAAAAEERAAGLDAMRRGCEDGDEVGFREVLVIAEDAGADAFAGEGEGDHHHPAAGFGLGGIVTY